VMTTAIALETSKGDLALALGLGLILISLALAINFAAMAVRDVARVRQARGAPCLRRFLRGAFPRGPTRPRANA
ncbi:MAG: hypothetical protein R3285_10160, partial [Kiloniellales bacterium]|nr:hypothetical protein [Kiloniellales bacterium]